MDSDRIIFVVGNSRSGTTMMGRILGNHSDVFTFDELHFFGQLWSPTQSLEMHLLDAEELAAKLFCIQRIGYRQHGNTDQFRQESQKFCEELSEQPISPTDLFSSFLKYEANLNGKSIPCDQTPRNVFYIDEILKVYPNARIVNMIRDPRDVLLSQKKKWKRRFLGATELPLRETFRDWINYHPITISRIWRTAVTAADRFSDHKNVHTVYFERLLLSPGKTVKEICRFVEIKYDDSLLLVPQVGSSEDEDKPSSIGINPDRVGNWNSNESKTGKLNTTEIYINQRLNGDLMNKHNYATVQIRPNVFRLFLYVVSFPIKLLFAFLCNLDRIKNIRETLRRRL